MLSRLRSLLFGSDEEEVEVIEESAPLLAQVGPPLMVLVSTGGILSFRLHTFLDVGQAAEFIQPWFPPGMSHGIVAFWALQEEPISTPEWGSAGGVETVVLVRDPARLGVVDLIECVDMESAHTLIRAEAERGLDIGLFMVYWAAQVSVQVDDEGLVRLAPASPPPTRRRPSEAEPASQVASTEPWAGAGESEVAATSSTALETPAASPVHDLQRTSAPAPPFDAQVPVDESRFAEIAEIEPELLQPPATDTVEAADALTAVPEAPAEVPPLPTAPLQRDGTLPKVIIIDHNEEARAVLGKILGASRFVVAGETGFGSKAIELARRTQPEIIMVAAEEPVPRATRMMEAIASSLPKSALVAYSALADSRNIRGAILAGADDYLATPIGQEDLVSSLQSVLAHKRRRSQRLLGEAAAPAATGRVITVFGAKGGIGKTTIATNLAVVIAQRTHQSVVLVDLDPRFGDVGVVLGISVEYSIADLVMPEEEIDREVIESCLFTHESGVKVLAAPWHPTRWRDV
jgi:CheY-like chemotaxis protein